MEHILRSHPIASTRFVRGEGSVLWDEAGRRYVDFESGIWCTSLGHGHPRIRAVAHDQIDRLIHLGTRFPSPLAEEAAEALLRTLPFPDGACVFLSSGSEAVELAARIARAVTDRPLLLTLAESYLSAFGSTGLKPGREWHIIDSGGSEARQEELLETMPLEEIGAFVFEPGSASGTVRFPSPGLISMLVSIVQARGGLVVANEVTTGLGRTGEWYGFEHYPIEPDVVAIGKTLGNGFPVSAVAMRREVAARLEGEGFRYAQSHQNDPIGCAIAREVIATIDDERLVARSRESGAMLIANLQALQRAHGFVREVRGRGLMAAIELDPAVPAESVCAALLERGFVAGYALARNVVRFHPPLNIATEDLVRLASALGEVLNLFEAHPAKGRGVSSRCATGSPLPALGVSRVRERAG